MPQVTMPDGAVVEMPDNPDPELLKRLRTYQIDNEVPTHANTPAPTPGAGAPEGLIDRIVRSFKQDPIVDMVSSGLKTTVQGAVPAAASMASNAAAQGVAGLTAPFLTGNTEDQAGFIRDFTANQTWQPEAGGEGAKLLEGLGLAFEPVANIKQGLGDLGMKTGSPLVATALDMAPDLAATFIGGPKGLQAADDLGAAVAPRVAPEPAKSFAKPDPRNPVEVARSLDFKVRPSDAERAGFQTPGRTAERYGAQDTQRSMVVDNQRAANDAVAEELGVQPGQRLDDATYEELRVPHEKTYADAEAAVQKVPLPPEFIDVYNTAVAAAKFPAGTAPTITRTIGALRRRASKKMQSDDVKIEEQGFADQAMADKLEEAFAQRLTALGDEAAYSAYTQARQSLAKIHDFESATRAGQVDVQKLYKLDERFPGRMTGRGKMLADIGAAFPDIARSALTAAGRDPTATATSIPGAIRDAAAGAVRSLPGLKRFTDVTSDAFQNRLGRPADPARRAYFDEYGRRPAAAEAPPVAPQGPGSATVEFQPQAGVTPPAALDLGRGIELLPEDVPNVQVLPETPDMLTADVVPQARRGDINFEPTPGLGLGDEFELDVRSGTQGAVGERELAELLAAQRSGDLEVMPPREMEQLDLGDIVTEQPRRLKLDPPPGTTRGGRTKERGFVRVRDPYENNASGDSSASAEAISRVRQEKEAGQDRFVIDLDDTVRPLTGVDAVDARARPGQVVVQRGIGKDEYTVLDRGGLSASQAKGRIQAAFTKRGE